MPIESRFVALYYSTIKNILWRNFKNFKCKLNRTNPTMSHIVQNLITLALICVTRAVHHISPQAVTGRRLRVKFSFQRENYSNRTECPEGRVEISIITLMLWTVCTRKNGVLISIYQRTASRVAAAGNQCSEFSIAPPPGNWVWKSAFLWTWEVGQTWC